MFFDDDCYCHQKLVVVTYNGLFPPQKACNYIIRSSTAVTAVYKCILYTAVKNCL